MDVTYAFMSLEKKSYNHEKSNCFMRPSPQRIDEIEKSQNMTTRLITIAHNDYEDTVKE